MEAVQTRPSLNGHDDAPVVSYLQQLLEHDNENYDLEQPKPVAAAPMARLKQAIGIAPAVEQTPEPESTGGDDAAYNEIVGGGS